MSRFSFVLGAALVGVIALACSAGPIAPSVAPSAPPTSPSPSPTSPSPSPTVTPPPSVAPPPATPAPTEPPVVATPRPPTPPPAAPGFSAAEQHLLDGVQRGTKNCEPAGGSDDLPRDALAGIECDSTDPAVARVGFYLFANDQDMIDAYLARMAAEGVALDSGSCNDGESEQAYIPYEGFAVDRAGCFLNDEGFAR